MNKNDLKVMVRGAYDLQKLRIQMGNRIVGNFKAKMGQKPSETEEDCLEEDEKKTLEVLRKSYKKMMDGLKIMPPLKKFKGDEVISSYTEFCLFAQYSDLESSEKKHFRKLEQVLLEFPIYAEYLTHVRGIGPAMAGVIVSEIDIEKAKYSSSIWKYCGLDVAPDGKGRSKKAEHLIDVEYTSKDGEIKQKKSITFNPFLKTKLIGVLGSSFLRAGDNKYSTVYRDYKHRLENHATYKDVSKGHRHNMAIRYMIKMFIIDLYAAWRAIEGLEVAQPYHEAKLGLKHKD